MAIYIYQFIIKNVIKDMNEEQEEEIHRVKFRRVPKEGASVPIGTGCATSCQVYQLRSSLKPILLGFFTEATSHRNDSSLI